MWVLPDTANPFDPEIRRIIIAAFTSNTLHWIRGIRLWLLRQKGCSVDSVAVIIVTGHCFSGSQRQYYTLHHKKRGICSRRPQRSLQPARHMKLHTHISLTGASVVALFFEVLSNIRSECPAPFARPPVRPLPPCEGVVSY